MATANVRAKISLDNSAFIKGINAVKAKAKEAADSIAKIGRGATAVITPLAAIGVAAAAGLALGVKQAIDFGGALFDLSQRTGIAVKELVILQQAFKDSGISADQVGPVINRMQKAIAGVNEDGEPTNKMFEKLGINLDQLKKLNPADQFKQIQKAIGNLASPAEKTAAAIALFGKSAGELVTLFRDGKVFENAAQVIGGQADILAANAEKFDKVSDGFKNIGTKLTGFFVGVASEVIPSLLQATDALNATDLSEIGKKFGKSIQSGINILTNAFKEGKLGELASISLKTGLAKAGDFFIGVIQTALNILNDGLKIVFSEDFFKGVGEGLKGAALIFGAFLVQAFKEPLTIFTAGMILAGQELVKVILNKLGPFWGDIVAKTSGKFLNPDEAFQAAKNATQNKPSEMLSQGKAAFAESQKLLTPAAQGFAKTIIDNLSNFKEGDLFGSKKLTQDLMALADSLNKPLQGLQDNLDAIGPQKPGTSFVNPSGAFAKPEAASALEKIGAIIPGGGGGALINFQRDTAKNTDTMAKTLKSIESIQKAVFGTKIGLGITGRFA